MSFEMKHRGESYTYKYGCRRRADCLGLPFNIQIQDKVLVRFFPGEAFLLGAMRGRAKDVLREALGIDLNSSNRLTDYINGCDGCGDGIGGGVKEVQFPALYHIDNVTV